MEIVQDKQYQLAKNATPREACECSHSSWGSSACSLIGVTNSAEPSIMRSQGTKWFGDDTFRSPGTIQPGSKHSKWHNLAKRPGIFAGNIPAPGGADMGYCPRRCYNERVYLDTQ